jgi:hypothetical protein
VLCTLQAGNTALHYAVQGGQEGIVKRLLRAGADTAIINKVCVIAYTCVLCFYTVGCGLPLGSGGSQAAAAAAADAYQSVVASKQGLFQADIVHPVPVVNRRPATASASASAAQRKGQYSSTEYELRDRVVSAAPPAVEDSDYRIFEERTDRRRPSSKGAPRSTAPAGSMADENASRKDKLLAMWDQQQKLQQHCGIDGTGLPDKRSSSGEHKMGGPRPRTTAMSSLLGGGGGGCGSRDTDIARQPVKTRTRAVVADFEAIAEREAQSRAI